MTRLIWGSFFDLLSLPIDFRLAQPQYDLLTLGSFGFLSYLLTKKTAKLERGSAFQIVQLKGERRSIELLGGAFYIAIAVLIAGAFASENFLSKLTHIEGLATLIRGVFVAFIVTISYIILVGIKRLRSRLTDEQSWTGYFLKFFET